MAADPRQPGMLEGLSRFLVQHERCGAGFDVAHPAGLGSGRVSITCRGCGARHEYATATIEVEREVRIEPTPPREPGEAAPAPETPTPPRRREPSRPARRIPPRPAPYPDSRRTEEDRPIPTSGAEARSEPKTAEEILRAHAAKAEGAARRRRGGRPGIAGPRRRPAPQTARGAFWRAPGAILVLLVLSAVALGFGVVWLVNEAGDDDPSTAPVAAPPVSAPPVQTTPVEPQGPAPSPVPGAPQPKTTTVQTERFTVEVPRSWSRRTAGGGLLLEPRGGGRVSVRVFYELSPELTAVQMARQTRDFMARRVPGARLLPNQTEIAGRSSFELTARGPGETAIAVNVLRGPYRFLILRRIFAGAKPQTSEAASRIVRSFRPN